MTAKHTRQSRRSFLAMAMSGLAASSLLAAACGPNEQIVYVSPPTATPLPSRVPAQRAIRSNVTGSGRAMPTA